MGPWWALHRYLEGLWGQLVVTLQGSSLIRLWWKLKKSLHAPVFGFSTFDVIDEVSQGFQEVLPLYMS